MVVIPKGPTIYPDLSQNFAYFLQTLLLGPSTAKVERTLTTAPRSDEQAASVKGHHK